LHGMVEAVGCRQETTNLSWASHVWGWEISLDQIYY